MKCPACDHDVPPDSEECPTCSTSVVDPAELALRLEDGSPPVTRGARPGAGAGPGTTENGHRFLPGTIWAGRYRISIALGRGGMGEVYRAEDLVLQQPVALKFLPEATERDAAKLAILFEEVRLARRIHHPNVCCVYDLGEAEGHHFISMEYIDGEDLAALLRRIGRLSRDKALEIAHQICDGLAAAHDQGVIHRDIKPTNLMIDGRGRARITDFGLAVATQNLDLDTTVHGGTPAYMAPEQIDGAEVSERSDLYALGLVLYELFTGRKPFEGVRLKELLLARRELAIRPPSELVEDLDPAIDREILRCLEVAPEKRPASARSLAAALPGGDGDSAKAALWRPAEGRPLPRRPQWTMERKLGEGGFGEVWLARHSGMGERRVFKFCHGARELHALKREIALFRLLKKGLGERDDITRIFDWSFDEPPYYIESEYSPGGNLVDWAEDRGGIGMVHLETRLEIVAQVAEALAAAHSVGVLHKDVKPGNVLIETSDEGRPRVRLSDFGIGLLTGDARLTEAGITPVSLTWTAGQSGTPLYRAPELLEGKPSTVQADVYSLGVMLYQMAVGDLHRALGPGWEREVDDELLRDDISIAVDRSPQRRLANALRVAERLRRLEERRADRESERDAVADAERARRALARLRRRLRWAMAGLAAVLLAAAVTYQARRLGEEARQTDRARELVRVAVASDWLAKDPTRAALVLTEIEEPEETPETVEMIYEVLGQELAWLELRHGEWVLDAAWSPDGRRLATSSSDGTVEVWNADGSGSPLVLPGHSAPVLAVAWSPDGKRLATASQDATARVLTPSGAGPGRAAGLQAEVLQAAVLQGHADWVWDVAWSPQGDRLATASWDRTARVWLLAPPGSPEEAAEPAVLEGHRERVVSVAWRPDGERLVTASWDGAARLWDKDGSPVLAAGRPVVLESPDALWTAAWSPDGRRLVTACWDGAARIWSFDDGGRPAGRPVVLQGRAGLWTAAWSPEGERLATASWDGTARVWHADGTPVRRGGEPVVFQHGDSVVSASWSPDGGRLVTASRDGTARVWNADGSPMRPDGILSQRGRAGQGVVLAGHGGEIWGSTWSPDGRRIVTASRDGTARVWRTDFGTRLESEIVEDVETVVGGRREHRSPDGKVMARVDEEGRVILASPERGRRVLGRALGEIVTVSWSPRGRRLLVASLDGAVRVWNLTTEVTGDELVFRADTDALLAAAFSADGERLFTASSNGTVTRWNADGSGEAMVFGGPSAGAVPSVPPGGAESPGVLVSAEFDRGAERLLTVSQGGIAEVWSLDGYPAGRALALVAEEAPLVSAWWGRDGRSVVAPLWDGTVREWRLEADVLVDYLSSATRVCLDPDFRVRNLGETAEEARSRYRECERSHGR